MLKRVVLNNPPCGTPVVVCIGFDNALAYFVCCVRSVRYDLIYSIARLPKWCVRSASSSTAMSSESNTREKFKATSTEFFFCLRASANSPVRRQRAVSHEWPLRKPCCLSDSRSSCDKNVNCCWASFSKIFKKAGRIAIGLQLAISPWSPFLYTGCTIAFFQQEGNIPDCSDRLRIFVMCM